MGQNTLKGIFFDLGGTLATAYPSVTEHISQTLADLGHPIPHREIASAAAIVSPDFDDPSNRGWSLSHERSYAFWIGYYTELLQELKISPTERATYALHIYNRLSRPQGYALYPDAIPVLEQLAGAGYTLGLISNWEAWGMELIPYLGISRYFPTQVLSGCVGLEKPDTAIFTLALAEANIAPEHALYVGDSVRFDIEPALAIGMRAVLIDRHAERSDRGASTIRSLRELFSHESIRCS
ncbi:MAG: HAD-IA family hydrolase [Chloroflexi bacterium]|nr:HAD-IA family hydrolase [Chloroflexota bacterium]